MFYQQLLDHQTTAIMVLDGALKVQYINPAAEALLEVSGRRGLGEYIHQLFSEENDSAHALDDAVSKSHGFSQRDAKITLLSGQQITVDYSVTPIIHANSSGMGKPSELLVEMQPRDRFKRISREEEIISTQAATQSLVRGVAHEVKNPLGGIRGAAQLLERELPNEELKEYTRIIIEEADRLRNLVDKLLGPRKLPQREATNIHEITERVSQLVQISGIGNVRIRKNYDPSVPDLQADREQLIQVVLNIVQNALQAFNQEAMDEQPEILIKTRVVRQFTIGHRRHRLVCQLTISDNGPGIPEKIRETLFYPMISGRADGTGLGLSIAQSIINQHQGIIECVSEPGDTRFVIYLPLDKNHE